MNLQFNDHLKNDYEKKNTIQLVYKKKELKNTFTNTSDNYMAQSLIISWLRDYVGTNGKNPLISQEITEHNINSKMVYT